MDQEKIDKILAILEGSQSFLAKSTKDIEKEFLNAVLTHFKDQFDIVDGRLVNNLKNKRLILGIKQNLLKVFENKSGASTLTSYLNDFDEIEKLNISLLKNEISVSEYETLKSENFSIAKEILTQNIVDTLSNKPTIIDQFTPNIRRTLFDSIVFQRTYKQAEKALKESILSEGKKDSTLLRYVKQISKDNINQYDGHIQDYAKEKFGLDGFMYLGRIQDNSRYTCIHLKAGSGEYSDLSLGGNKYKVSDIQKIIDRSKDNPGWNPDTTVSNFATNRGGFSCNHAVRFFKLLPSDLKGK